MTSGPLSVLVLGCFACVAACSSPPPRPVAAAPIAATAPIAPPVARAAPPPREPARARIETAEIPVQTAEGEIRLKAATFWPEDATPDHPRPVIVFAHGSPMTASEREHMTVFDESWALQWFLHRGYVVIAALRRGFGASGGHFSEGVDRAHHDFEGAGRIAALDIRASLAFARSLPGVNAERIVLAGKSAGGFGSLALASEGVAVRGVISFAGGKGAPLLGEGPTFTTAITAAAEAYGRTTHVPSLWIYAANDSFFAPPIAIAMFDAYRSAGAPAEMLRLPALGRNGHALFTAEAVSLWTKTVEEFLARVDMTVE